MAATYIMYKGGKTHIVKAAVVANGERNLVLCWAEVGTGHVVHVEGDALPELVVNTELVYDKMTELK